MNGSVDRQVAGFGFSGLTGFQDSEPLEGFWLGEPWRLECLPPCVLSSSPGDPRAAAPRTGMQGRARKPHAERQPQASTERVRTRAKPSPLKPRPQRLRFTEKGDERGNTRSRPKKAQARANTSRRAASAYRANLGALFNVGKQANRAGVSDQSPKGARPGPRTGLDAQQASAIPYPGGDALHDIQILVRLMWLDVCTVSQTLTPWFATTR